MMMMLMMPALLQYSSGTAVLKAVLAHASFYSNSCEEMCVALLVFALYMAAD